MNSFNNSNFCPRQNPKQNNLVVEHYRRRTPTELCTSQGGEIAKADSNSNTGPDICVIGNNTPSNGQIKFSWENNKNYVCKMKNKDGSCNKDSYRIHVHSDEQKNQPTVYFKKDGLSKKPVDVDASENVQDYGYNTSSGYKFYRLNSMS